MLTVRRQALRLPPGEGGPVGRSPSGPTEPGIAVRADPGPGGSGQRPARPSGRAGGSGHPDQRAADGGAPDHQGKGTTRAKSSHPTKSWFCWCPTQLAAYAANSTKHRFCWVKPGGRRGSIDRREGTGKSTKRPCRALGGTTTPPKGCFVLCARCVKKMLTRWQNDGIIMVRWYCGKWQKNNGPAVSGGAGEA